MGVMPTLPAIRRMLTASGPSFSSTRNAHRAIRCSVLVWSTMPIHCIASNYTLYSIFLLAFEEELTHILRGIHPCRPWSQLLYGYSRPWPPSFPPPTSRGSRHCQRTIQPVLAPFVRFLAV